MKQQFSIRRRKVCLLRCKHVVKAGRLSSSSQFHTCSPLQYHHVFKTASTLNLPSLPQEMQSYSVTKSGCVFHTGRRGQNIRSPDTIVVLWKLQRLSDTGANARKWLPGACRQVANTNEQCLNPQTHATKGPKENRLWKLSLAIPNWAM